MAFPRNNFKRRGIAGLAVIFNLLCVASGSAQGVTLESAGVRFGISARQHFPDFKQSEAFVNWNLPWSYRLFPRWHMQWRLDCSAGWLGGNGDDAAIFSSGPSLAVRRDHIPLAIEFGTIPTLVSRDTFGSKSIGSLLQFTTYGALDLNLGRHARLGYRFQHMSNAGLDGNNPGLNLHVLQVSWGF